MKNRFKVCKTNRTQRQQDNLNLKIPKSDQVCFGARDLHLQGPRVWDKNIGK